MKVLNFDSVAIQSSLDFRISTKEEAILFEKQIHAIYDNQISCPGKIVFGLGNIFEVCHKFVKEYGGRVFTAIIDLAISQTNCVCELDDCIKIWNRYFSSENEFGNKPQSSLLENEKTFEGKFYYQRHLNSFVFKYRAHWDKIMGLYFLIWKYDLYQDFIKARSKKRMFLKEFDGHMMVNEDIVNYVKNELTAFDENFRTHEAHGTGKLRKFAFANGLEDSQILLEHLVNATYGNYIKLAPKIFKCIEYFLLFPDVVERLQKEKE